MVLHDLPPRLEGMETAKEMPQLRLAIHRGRGKRPEDNQRKERKMRVSVYLEIETTDWEGKEFKREIEKLIADIDQGRQESSLVAFDMFSAENIVDPRNYYWQEEAE